jgi:hypothetical protein
MGSSMLPTMIFCSLLGAWTQVPWARVASASWRSMTCARWWCFPWLQFRSGATCTGVTPGGDNEAASDRESLSRQPRTGSPPAHLPSLKACRAPSRPRCPDTPAREATQGTPAPCAHRPGYPQHAAPTCSQHPWTWAMTVRPQGHKAPAAQKPQSPSAPGVALHPPPRGHAHRASRHPPLHAHRSSRPRGHAHRSSCPGFPSVVRMLRLLRTEPRPLRGPRAPPPVS